MSLVTAKKILVAPSAANAITPVSGGAWASGAWVTALAATGNAAVLLGVAVGSVAASTQFEIDLGTGGAGSEVVLATIRCYQPTSAFDEGGIYFLKLPVSGVASGGRIAVRVRDHTATTTIPLAVLYIESADFDDTTAHLHKVLPSAADATSVTPSSTGWANSAWVQMTAGIANEISLSGLVTDNPTSAVDLEWDIGIGGSGSEVVVTTLRSAVIAGAATSGTLWFIQLPAVLPIAASTRVAIRVRKTGTSTTATAAALQYYDNTSLIVLPSTFPALFIAP